MIDFLLRTSLRHRLLVLTVSGLLTVLGVLRLSAMPVDVFPDLTAPRVTIVTELSGMAPTEIEQLVTFPVETTVNGVSGVRRVRSASAPGISIVWVEFDWNTPDLVARQRVTERLQALSSLPPGADGPTLAPPSSVMGEIAFVALTSAAPRSPATAQHAAPALGTSSTQRAPGEAHALELRHAGDITVRRRLLAVPGVANVVALGGLERQFHIEADPARLERLGFTLDDLVTAVRGGNANAPGGYAVQSGQESVVRVLGRARDAGALGRITLGLRDGHAVRVADVATVKPGGAVPRGTASYNGAPAVVLSIVKQPGADTLAVTAAVDAALDELGPTLGARGMTLHRDLFRQATFITTAVKNVMAVLRDGAVLVIAVLLVFLWSLRPTVISAVALPLSLVLSVLVLDALGLSIDTMTLGGLAIAIGELVDDAIVDVENVVRRLRERAALPPDARQPVSSTVLEASREVRGSIVSATAILMVVFVPLLFLDGLEGRLLRPLGIAYLVSIASSLVVAVTVTPVLCTLLLGKTTESAETTQRTDNAPAAHASEPPLLRALTRWYTPWLTRALARPGAVVTASAVFTAAGLLALLGLGRSFLPTFNEGSLTVAAVTLPGTSLAQSDALGRLAEKALLADPAVVSTARRTGRAERDEHVQGVEAAEIDVHLRPDSRDKDTLLADIRRRLAIVPGMQFTIGQPISHRIDHMLSGQRTALSVKLFGTNLADLRRTAAAVEAALKDVPGLVDVSAEQAVNVPQLVVDVDAAAAAPYGLSRGAAARTASTALWGQTATQVFTRGALTDVVVRYPAVVRTDRASIARTRVPTPSGAVVPLSAFATIRDDSGPNYILRENVERRLVVTANVAGRDVRGAARDVQAAVAKNVVLPAGVRVAYAGQFEREAAASTRLYGLGALALLGIVLILFSTLGAWRRTAIVLVNLPLALAGGVLGVYLGGGVLSIASIIGFITLFGIATRGGILLATRTRDLEHAGLDRATAVHQAATERLAPILMTAVTAGLGLLPLALALGQPGAEIQAPMALVILTGLASSTTLNMLVVPALLATWGGPPGPRSTP